MYSRMMKVKAANPSIKVMLSVGGWTHGTAPFSAVVTSESSMHTFAQNVVKYLRQRHFDGFDIDWEYPGSRGSPAGDKQKYTRFLQMDLLYLKILKDAFTAEAAQSGKPRLLLSAAVAAGKSAVTQGYEISKVSAILDQINLMSYDLHGSWESAVGENSPLYAARNDYGDDATMNQDWAVKYWLDHGCPPEKLIMGLGTYGRSLHLSQPGHHGIHDRINGPGTMGTITKEQGFLSYYEICLKLKAGYTRVWNDEQKVPYAYSGSDWVGYDDVQSFQVKADYIKSKHLGGAMVWTIDLDDFANKCGQGKYPLMNVLKNKLLGNNQNVVPVTQQQTTPTTRTTTTTRTTWHPTQHPVTQNHVTQQHTQHPATAAPQQHHQTTATSNDHSYQQDVNRTYTLIYVTVDIITYVMTEGIIGQSDQSDQCTITIWHQNRDVTELNINIRDGEEVELLCDARCVGQGVTPILKWGKDAPNRVYFQDIPGR
ncbi:hypothetical protein KUTeg_002402 [Tegillarca granosa]|uniref:GH18 domain-containing protein n=1 Tax=Tegillarca granosa TaxID=220873 RepID=A0ABQ9FX10_TEGGR|nr:hypothetical protein KUTeg_002402 [Tegillarca granosa]